MDAALSEIALRLGVATVAAGAVGLNRDLHGKPIGVRTLGLVGLSAAVVVLLADGGIIHSTMSDATSRVIQGIAAGIGFLCAGTILKGGADTARVKGLTTAAGLWLSTAIGICVGRGHSATAVLGTLLALLVLHSLPRLFERPRAPRKTAKTAKTAEQRHVP